MTIDDKAEKSRKTRKTIFALLIGGVAGFLGALGISALIDSGALGALGLSREIALLIAMVYLITGVAVGFGLVNPKLGSKFLNVEDADELREQRVMLGYSTVGIIALGGALAIAALAAPTGPVPAGIALAAIIVLFAVCWFATKRQMRHMDELMQSVSLATGSMAFYLMLLIGGGWALLAHLGYVGGPEALDWLSMFAALLLLAAFIVCGKRGMLTMR